MAYQVVVDFDTCLSNGICTDTAPVVFEIRDDGFLYLLQDYPSEDLKPQVEEAVLRCPTQAISIVED